MINCPNCNHQNPDGALQCEACYTPLPALANCPNCNISIQADASFCGQCGSDLRNETLTPSTPQTAPTESAAPTQAVFPQAPELESETAPDSELKTQNFLVPPESSTSHPDADMPELVIPDPLVIPEPVNPAPVGHEENASTTGHSGTEISAELDPFAEAETKSTEETEPAPMAEPNAAPAGIELTANAEPEPTTAAEPEPIVEPAAAPSIATPTTVVRQSSATQLQITNVRLKQVQTNALIELPRELSVVRIGKPNDHTPPDIDVSGFPDSEIVSRVHASIRVEGDTYFLEDVGSSNGTYINGLPLPVGNRHRLRPGDRIAFGKGDKVSFIFEISS